MQKISYNERIDHLKQPENKETQKKRKNLTKEHSETIFNLLNTDEEFDTSFETKSNETYFGTESYRYYTNIKFYFTKKEIKQLRWKTKQNYETDDFFIWIHKSIIALNKQKTALEAQKLLDKEYRRAVHQKGVKQLYFDFFPEETETLSEKEKKPEVPPQVSINPTYSTTPKTPQESDDEPKSRISKYYDN